LQTILKPHLVMYISRGDYELRTPDPIPPIQFPSLAGVIQADFKRDEVNGGARYVVGALTSTGDVWVCRYLYDYTHNSGVLGQQWTHVPALSSPSNTSLTVGAGLDLRPNQTAIWVLRNGRAIVAEVDRQGDCDFSKVRWSYPGNAKIHPPKIVRMATRGSYSVFLGEDCAVYRTGRREGSGVVAKRLELPHIDGSDGHVFSAVYGASLVTGDARVPRHVVQTRGLGRAVQ
jgi:hypothetical protein